MELIISFDDTGSMSAVRKDVRYKINQLVEDLFGKINDLRVGIIIHNDYCDHDTIQKLELTNNKQAIINFVNTGSSCGGGDAPECYELVLHEFQNFDWQSDNRVAILIGDEVPHEAGYRYGKWLNQYLWQHETIICAKKGIKVYSIQALYNKHANYFYETVAKLGNGVKLDLSQFAHITQYLSAIAYQQVGQLDQYQEANPEFKTNLALANMFNKLKGIVVDDKVVEALDKKLVMLSRFQVLDVPSRIRINDFITARGSRYKAGRGFYQLVKSETVQAKKQILMVHKKTGEIIDDTNVCRRMLGLPIAMESKINPRLVSICKDYDVYIQSTSYTRQLDAGTNFLYEVDRY